MSRRFLHLAVYFKEGGNTSERRSEIQEVLNKAKDWLRYTSNCWLIYTRASAQTWHERLQKITWMKDQHYLICEVNLTERSGWVPQNVWDWISKDREPEGPAKSYKPSPLEPLPPPLGTSQGGIRLRDLMDLGRKQKP